MPITKGIQMGLKTHHQDQVIAPINFNIINTVNNVILKEQIIFTISISVSLIFIYITIYIFPLKPCRAT